LKNLNIFCSPCIFRLIIAHYKNEKNRFGIFCLDKTAIIDQPNK
jgi:hypothetical protein